MHRSVTSSTLSTTTANKTYHQGHHHTQYVSSPSSSASQSSNSAPSTCSKTLLCAPQENGNGPQPSSKVYSPRLEKCRSALKSISSPNFTLLKLQKALSHTSLILGGSKPRKPSLSNSTQDLSKQHLLTTSASSTSCSSFSAITTGCSSFGRDLGSNGASPSPSAMHSGATTPNSNSGKARNLASMRLRLSLPNRCMACGSLVAHDRVQCRGYVFHRDCFKCSR